MLAGATSGSLKDETNVSSLDESIDLVSSLDESIDIVSSLDESIDILSSLDESINFLAKKLCSDRKSWERGWCDGRYF